jgi:hypothetical protein
VHGLEWCLFNRTAAFDDIIARAEAQEKREAAEKGSPHSSETGDSDSTGPRRRAAWKKNDVSEPPQEDSAHARTCTSTLTKPHASVC